MSQNGKERHDHSNGGKRKDTGSENPVREMNAPPETDDKKSEKGEKIGQSSFS
jgi:hypothetical protein